MKTQLTIPFFAIMMLAFNSYSQDGASIFKKNCAVCHTVGKGKLVGPDLKGSDKKYDIKWMTEWVKSSQTMVKKKDPAAVKIFEDNKKMIMPDQALSDDEIKTVTAFIGEETAKLDQPAVATPSPAIAQVEAPASSQSSSSSTGVTSKTVIYILLGIITFLTVLLIGLSKVIKDLVASHRE